MTPEDFLALVKWAQGGDDQAYGEWVRGSQLGDEIADNPDARALRGETRADRTDLWGAPLLPGMVSVPSRPDIARHRLSCSCRIRSGQV